MSAHLRIRFDDLDSDVRYRIFGFLAPESPLCLPPRERREKEKRKGAVARYHDRALSNLCLVSRSCRETAQALIFRRVMLNSDIRRAGTQQEAAPAGKLRSERGTQLLEFLTIHPRVAALIKTLELFVHEIKVDPTAVQDLLIEGLLPACINLQQLWLFMGNTKVRSPVESVEAIRSYLDGPMHSIQSLKVYVNEMEDLGCLPVVRSIPYVFVGIDLDGLAWKNGGADAGQFPAGSATSDAASTLAHALAKATVLRLYGDTDSRFGRDGYDFSHFLARLEPPHSLSLRGCHLSFSHFTTLMQWAGHGLAHLDCRGLQLRERSGTQVYLETDPPPGSYESYASSIRNLKSIAFSRFVPYGFTPLPSVGTLEFDNFATGSCKDVRRWAVATGAGTTYGSKLRKIVLKKQRGSRVDRDALQQLMEFARPHGIRVLMAG